MSRRAELISLIRASFDSRPKLSKVFIQDKANPDLYYSIDNPAKLMARNECLMMKARHHLFMVRATQTTSNEKPTNTNKRN